LISSIWKETTVWRSSSSKRTWLCWNDVQ